MRRFADGTQRCRCGWAYRPALHFVWTADRHAGQARAALPRLRIWGAVFLRRGAWLVFDECHANEAFARLHGDPEFQLPPHATRGRLALLRHRLRRRPADQLHPFAVDGDFDFIAASRAVPATSSCDFVFAIHAGSSCESASPPRVPNGSSSTRASCSCSGFSL